MSTPLVRGGKLQGSPLKGIDADLSRLNRAQIDEMQAVMNKSDSGASLNMKDLKVLLQAREAAVTGVADPTTQLRNSLRDMTRTMNGLTRGRG